MATWRLCSQPPQGWAELYITVLWAPFKGRAFARRTPGLAQSSTIWGPNSLRDIKREGIFGRPYADNAHGRHPADALLARRRLSLQARPRRVSAGLALRAGRDGSPD